MTKLDELRKAVLDYPNETFTYAAFKPVFGHMASSRLPDLVRDGTIQIVGTIKKNGLKATNVYALVDPKMKQKEVVKKAVPLNGMTLHAVKWNEATASWKESTHPCHDPIPLCPDLLELLVIMNAAYEKPQKIGYANRGRV